MWSSPQGLDAFPLLGAGETSTSSVHVVMPESRAGGVRDPGRTLAPLIQRLIL